MIGISTSLSSQSSKFLVFLSPLLRWKGKVEVGGEQVRTWNFSHGNLGQCVLHRGDFCFEKERRQDKEENKRGRDRERRLRAANPKTYIVVSRSNGSHFGEIWSNFLTTFNQELAGRKLETARCTQNCKSASKFSCPNAHLLQLVQSVGPVVRNVLSSTTEASCCNRRIETLFQTVFLLLSPPETGSAVLGN